MKIFGEEIVFEIENKKRAVLMVAVMIVCLGFTGVNLAGKIFQGVSPAPAKETASIAETSKTETADWAEIKAVKTPVSLENLLSVNPFYEMKNLTPLDRDEEFYYGARSTGSIPLPHLPASAGKPLAIGVPELPGGSTAKASGDASAVKGIMSDNRGYTMAIMGDGKILSPGDSYNGIPVTAVQSYGVVLENGQVLAFK